MKQSEIGFYFMPFSELELSENIPVMALVFEDQRDLVIAQKFPEFELERSRLDNVRGKGNETIAFIPLTRDKQIFAGGIVYINYPWRRTRSLDFDSLNFYRKIGEQIFRMVGALRRRSFKEVNILLPSRFHPENISNSKQKQQLLKFVKTIAEAVIYANCSLDDFKANKSPRIEKVTFTYFGCYDQSINAFFQKAIGNGEVVGQALGYVRRLIELPPNYKTPLSFIEGALGVNLSKFKPNTSAQWRKIREHRFSSNVNVNFLYGLNAIRNFGFGLVAAVGQGSIHEPCVLKVHYKPKTKRKKKVKKISLTGKGVTFDTGGIDLKLTDSYENMHYDMAGAAVVMGLIKLADEMDLKVEIIGLMPLVRNAIGGDAIEPNSVITAYNGRTVEVINTDAEGRLILGDVVAYSEKHIHPDCTLSVATLCNVEEVAPGILKVLATTDALKKKVWIAEKNSSEPVMLWPSPEYLSIIDDNLVGDHTDLVNDIPSFGYHSNGIMFVYDFFDYSPTNWIYVDVAAIFEDDAFDYYAGPGLGLKFMWHLVRLFE